MKHHLMIAGTGRAGTSFLVQFLHACGLETHLSKHTTGAWDADANAGLEDFPAKGADLPYVIKSPWFFEFAHSLLERDDITLDAAIIPVRDLVEAASSRAIIELRARHASRQLPDDENTWETWAGTPGGLLYSLNPLDEARLLAVGFHEVIHALVRHEIPIVFLDFPRFATDPIYAASKLENFIPVTKEQAITTHVSLSDPSKIRAGRELAEQQSNVSGGGADKVLSPGVKHPTLATLDLIALRREAKRLQASLDALASENKELKATISDLESTRDALLADRTSSETALASAAQAHQNALESADILRLELAKQLREADQREAALRVRIHELESSTSWRLTSPIRALKHFFSSTSR